VLRKLREKLRNYVENKNAIRQKILQSFEDQCKELIGDYTLSSPWEFYKELAAKSFDFADKYPGQRF